jgi:hypothetical protein
MCFLQWDLEAEAQPQTHFDGFPAEFFNSRHNLMPIFWEGVNQTGLEKTETALLSVTVGLEPQNYS